MSDDPHIARREGNALQEADGTDFNALTEGETYNIWTRLGEAHRNMFVQVLAEIDREVKDGRMKPITAVEKNRIAILRVCEMIGMLEFMTNDDAMFNRDLQGFINLARQMGNSAQQMMGEAVLEATAEDTTFDRLKKVKKREVIDVDDI